METAELPGRGPGRAGPGVGNECRLLSCGAGTVASTGVGVLVAAVLVDRVGAVAVDPVPELRELALRGLDGLAAAVLLALQLLDAVGEFRGAGDVGCGGAALGGVNVVELRDGLLPQPCAVGKQQRLARQGPRGMRDGMSRCCGGPSQSITVRLDHQPDLRH